MPLGGTVTNPRTGKRVDWRPAEPVKDLHEQAKSFRVPILGVIGNRDHLLKSGDHTPWSRGKAPGVVYAIDLGGECETAKFRDWLVGRLKAGHYQWVDFINIRNSQYDRRGVRLKSSGDHHLHVSVEKGFEDTSTTMLLDYFRPQPKPSPPAEEGFLSDLTDEEQHHVLYGTTVRLDRVEKKVDRIEATLGNSKTREEDLAAQVKGLHDKLDALARRVDPTV